MNDHIHFSYKYTDTLDRRNQRLSENNCKLFSNVASGQWEDLCQELLRKKQSRRKVFTVK